MRISRHLLALAVFAAIAALGVRFVVAEQRGSNNTMIVTAEGKGGQPVSLRQGDVMIYEGHDRIPVTEVKPLQGSAPEVYLAIDETLGQSLGTQMNDLRQFVQSQPTGEEVGIVYLRNGGVDIRQKPTTDHAAATRALRLPVDNSGSSPFESIVALLKQWPSNGARHEIVLVSDGIEPFGPTVSDNPYVDAAVSAAQRDQVPVFAIWMPAAGHWGHTFWRTSWGETYLSRLSDESGGEAYGVAGMRVPSIAPYLTDVSKRLQHQYEVAFTPQPQTQSGFEPVRVTTEVPDVDLNAPDRIWVEAGR